MTKAEENMHIFGPHDIQHNDIQYIYIQHNNELNMTLCIMKHSIMVKCCYADCEK